MIIVVWHILKEHAAFVLEKQEDKFNAKESFGKSYEYIQTLGK